MLMSGLVYLVKMAILLFILYIYFFKIMQIVLFTDVQNSVTLSASKRNVSGYEDNVTCHST